MAEATTAAEFLYTGNIIDEDELLSVVQGEADQTVPLFSYLTCKRFTLGDVTDDESLTEFCFLMNDITRLIKAFSLPTKIFVKMELQLQQKKDYVCCRGDLPIHAVIATLSHDLEEVNLNFP